MKRQMQEVFIAEDGTQFLYGEECREYEKRFEPKCPHSGNDLLNTLLSGNEMHLTLWGISTEEDITEIIAYYEKTHPVGSIYEYNLDTVLVPGYVFAIMDWEDGVLAFRANSLANECARFSDLIYCIGREMIMRQSKKN